MTTYYITWASVFLLGSVAQRTDYPSSSLVSQKRILHSGKTRFFYLIAVSILVFVAGCRYYIGADYYAYYGWYQDYASSLGDRIRTLNEPAISLIYAAVVRFIDDGFACVFVANAIIIILAAWTLYKYTDRIAIALILYTLLCWTDTFNGMRQALAVAVVFAGLPFLKERKLIKFSITVFAAFLCHRSAAVFVLIYFAVFREVNLRNILILAAASVVVLRSYDRLFELTGAVLDKDFTDLDAYASRHVNILRIAAKLAPAIYFCIRNWRQEKDRMTTFHLNILILNGLFALSTSNSAYLARASMYLAPFEVLAISELLKREGRNREIITVGIVLLFMIFEGYEIMHSSDLSPFRWIWTR